jgi:pimeloyl-ACP methyl ester carboxylesterase
VLTIIMHSCSPRFATNRLLQVLAIVLAALPSGCSYGITVRRAGAPDLLNAWHASIVEADDLSPRTRQALHRWDLDGLYERSPTDVYAQLQAKAVDDPQPELLFALAEISYLLGRKAEKWEKHEACVYYYSCAGYAYHYLFDGPAEGHSAFDPRFRLACDLYNTGVAKLIRAAQKVGRLDSRQQLVLPAPDGRGFTLSVVHHGFPWKSAEFGPLLFSSDYDVVGLANQYRGYGLGVALIGTRVQTKESRAAPGNTFYPHEVSFPVTAFFRFEGSIADLSSRRAGRLELYNPLAIQTINVRHWAIPLETDLTTPLAYFLSHTDLDGIEYTGFLHPDEVQDRTGIYMFEPYQPGKIPVLMVHGLLSSPLTWTTMFNDLRADPTLRQNYQFWFYQYPSGQPYLSTAADLRQTLAKLRAELDPAHADAALDQMILVGHSMGGLVSRLMTLESGNDFWQLVSKEPFAQVKVTPRTRAELARLFFFAPVPEVRRVIFIGTPHHGSKLGASFPAKLADQFVTLPKQLLRTARDAAKEDPHLLLTLGEKQIPTNLDLLAPGAPGLELLASRSRPEWVHYHSIIGEAYGSGKDGSDGIVPYTSAHLDGVDSEIVVPASHLYIHHHPRAILEVWRILLEHLREIQGRDDFPPAPVLELDPQLSKSRRGSPGIVRR